MKLISLLMALLLLPVHSFCEEVQYRVSPSSGRVVFLKVENVSVPVLSAKPLDATPIPTPAVAAGKAAVVRSLLPANTRIAAARDFLRTYGGAFGSQGASSELVAGAKYDDALGYTHVRFNQFYKGIEVLGAGISVHVKKDGKISFAGGAVGADLAVSTVMRKDRGTVERFAKRLFRTEFGGMSGALKEIHPMIIKPSMLSGGSASRAFLVWAVRLHAANGLADKTYFVDANTLDLRYVMYNTQEIKRRTYDCSTLKASPCYSNLSMHYDDARAPWASPPGPADFRFGCREEQDPPCPLNVANPRYLPEQVFDTDNLYVWLGGVHNLYQTMFGRNGANNLGGNVDGAGSPTVETEMSWSYINWLPGNSTCTTAVSTTSFGIQFCKGMVSPDLIAHEYAHRDHDAIGLLYQGESGALDESHSDLIGELFENSLYGQADWINGSQSIAGGVRRSLVDPPSLSDDYPPPSFGPYPDRYTSSYMYCGSGDSSGVHHNSTVPSKALYLASVGGSFNGCSISAIGINKVAQIVERSILSHYTSSESFNSAYFHQVQSCIELYGAASTECREFIHALQSVEMDQVGYCGDSQHLQTHPATCRCVDSDDWQSLGNYAQQGALAGAVDFEGRTYADHCASQKNLVEQYCQGGQRYRALITCPNACRDGACV